MCHGFCRRFGIRQRSRRDESVQRHTGAAASQFELRMPLQGCVRMPIRFQYDPVLRILFSTVEGLVSFRDIDIHLTEENRERALAHRELVDASAATTNLSGAEVKAVVERLRRLMQKGPFGPTALVTSDNTLFGMANMLAILSDLQGGPSVGVFRTFDEALDWLVRK